MLSQTDAEEIGRQFGAKVFGFSPERMSTHADESPCGWRMRFLPTPWIQETEAEFGVPWFRTKESITVLVNRWDGQIAYNSFGERPFPNLDAYERFCMLHSPAEHLREPYADFLRRSPERVKFDPPIFLLPTAWELHLLKAEEQRLIRFYREHNMLSFRILLEGNPAAFQLRTEVSGSARADSLKDQIYALRQIGHTFEDGRHVFSYDMVVDFEYIFREQSLITHTLYVQEKGKEVPIDEFRDFFLTVKSTFMHKWPEAWSPLSSLEE